MIRKAVATGAKVGTACAVTAVAALYACTEETTVPPSLVEDAEKRYGRQACADARRSGGHNMVISSML